MRTGFIFLQQHTGRTFQWIWRVKKKRVVVDEGLVESLQEKGFKLTSAQEVAERISISTNPPFVPRYEMPGFMPKRVEMNESHPDYHEHPCLIFKDSNVLIEGLKQAMVFTNSVSLSENMLPISCEQSEENPVKHKLVRRAIKASLLYDAYQEKLPKLADPERPAWNFPRVYGIRDFRRNRLLGNRLLQLCANFNPERGQQLTILSNANFATPLFVQQSAVILSLRADKLLLVDKELKPYVSPEETRNHDVPDIYPFSPVISIEPCRFFKFEDHYPIKRSEDMKSIHTAFVHFNETEVTNLHDSPVSEDQILGRSLMKCFAFAVAQARQKFGPQVEELPRPLTLQCIQTDGKWFHFSIFQLNTTSAESNYHNVYWSLPPINLYEKCEYEEGVPVLKGYNPEVLDWLCTFYNNS